MKKIISYIINLLALIGIILSLFAMSNTLISLKAKSINSIPSLTDTTEFKNITKNKISNLFKFLDLADKYEKNDETNKSTIVATTYINNAYRDFTLQDVIDLASINQITIVNNMVSENNIDAKNNNTRKYLFSNLIYEDEAKPTSLLENRMTEYELCLKILNHYSSYLLLKEEFSKDKSNFFYVLRYTRDNRIIENKNTTTSINDILSSKAFLYLSSEVSEVKTNIEADTTEITRKILDRMPAHFQNYYFACGVDIECKKDDVYKTVFNRYTSLNSRFKISNILLVICLAILVVTFIYNIIQVVNSTKKKKKSQFFLYHIPTDLYIFLMIIALITINIMLPNKEEILHVNTYLRVAVNYFIIFTFIIFFNEKYINLCSEEPILISKLYSTYIYDIKKVSGNIPVFAYVLFYAIPLLLILIISLYAIYLYFSTFPDIFYLYVGLIGCFICFLIVVFTIIINKAFINALREKEKSEQMKLELISNVSHDIRTPLTSIINYADILNKTMKEDKWDKNEAMHFSDIIYDKSNRLKILIEDLIYSTKASSGTLEVNMQKLDANELAAQYFADYEDRLKQRKLKITKNIENEHNYIYADGEKLYRIFENIFSNIFKYAKEDTSITFSIKELKNNEKIEIKVQNISAEDLSKDENDLTERFVRGDKSRNKEGFGLGLSIVTDLAKLMLGKYEVKIDREQNIFINRIIFDKYNGF